MRIGIIGAGNIASKVAPTLLQMPEAECYAIASRDIRKAEAFRDRFGFEKAYGSYEEMLADEKTEFVYIATPHSHHARHMRLCIRYKKPFLCEKSFTMNAGEAAAVLKEAEEAGVFAADALWTRYMPSRGIIKAAVESGIVGEIKALTANLSAPVSFRERLVDPALCGGALLDVGIYPVNFALMAFGEEPERVETSCVFTERGVDAFNTVTLYYKDGRMASCVSGMLARSDRRGVFYGTKGYIEVDNVNNPGSVKAYGMNDELLTDYPLPPVISGYEYEFRECFAAIRDGLLEPPSLPHERTVAVMKLLDGIRAKWGLKYPMERDA